jgi:hypothetical protein
MKVIVFAHVQKPMLHAFAHLVMSCCYLTCFKPFLYHKVDHLKGPVFGTVQRKRRFNDGCHATDWVNLCCPVSFLLQSLDLMQPADRPCYAMCNCQSAATGIASARAPANCCITLFYITA